MPAIRTNRGFVKLSDGALSEFLAGVATGLGNAVFANPPVKPTDLNTLKTNFDAAVVAAAQGGTGLTAAEKAVRDSVTDALNKDASYVDITANGDLTTLLLSGFQPVSTNRAQIVLDPPQIIAVDHGQSGELKVRVMADTNARSFVGRIKKATDGDFGPTVSFASSRAILFQGLTAGITYVMQLCAIGGSTGKSDWTEPVSKMAM